METQEDKMVDNMRSKEDLTRGLKRLAGGIEDGKKGNAAQAIALGFVAVVEVLCDIRGYYISTILPQNGENGASVRTTTKSRNY